MSATGFSERVKVGIRTLFPGYFALVMATGIVSVAAHGLGYQWVAKALWWLNLAAYAVLVAMLGTRLARLAVYPKRVLDDLKDHARGRRRDPPRRRLRTLSGPAPE